MFLFATKQFMSFPICILTCSPAIIDLLTLGASLQLSFPATLATFHNSLLSLLDPNVADEKIGMFGTLRIMIADFNRMFGTHEKERTKWTLSHIFSKNATVNHAAH